MKKKYLDTPTKTKKKAKKEKKEKKEKKALEYRMYGLVPYNLSPIQQGIQYGHAVVEYAQSHGEDKDYKKWAKKDKTFIILNGGTTNLKADKLGTLNKHRDELMKNGISVATFFEPDLGDQLTAVVFLVDERVFNRAKYPDIEENPGDCDWWDSVKKKDLQKILFLREFLQSFKLA